MYHHCHYTLYKEGVPCILHLQNISKSKIFGTAPKFVLLKISQNFMLLDKNFQAIMV